MKILPVLFGVAAILVAGPKVMAASLPSPGAASCSGCHAAGAASTSSVPRLYGRNAGEIATAMNGFRDGSLPATVMNRIAKGFSDDEVRAIAAWLAAQR